MVFDIKKSNNKKVEEMYDRAMEELGDFFEINWNENRPKIILVDSREVLDVFSEEKTEKWFIATTTNTSNEIVMFSPERIESESSHRYSDDFYYKLLKHELAHQYSNIFRKTYYPNWLGEGVAVYISGQIEEQEKPQEFKNFLKYFYKSDEDVYIESPFVIKILIEEFGKNKVIEFLKISDTENEEEFNKIFKDFFGVVLSYDWFNKMLEKRK